MVVMLEVEGGVCLARESWSSFGVRSVADVGFGAELPRRERAWVSGSHAMELTTIFTFTRTVHQFISTPMEERRLVANVSLNEGVRNR